MFPDTIGLHQSDGHLVPQADPHRHPPQVVVVVRGQIAIGGRTFSMSWAIFSPPPPPSWESNPIVNDCPPVSRVLWDKHLQTGHRTPIVVSGENPLRSGIVESGCVRSGECKDVGGKSW